MFDARLAANASLVAAILAFCAVLKLLAATTLCGQLERRLESSRLPVWIVEPLQTLLRTASQLVGWTAFTLAVGSLLIGAAYHLGGGDAAADLRLAAERLTAAHLAAAGWVAGQAVLLAAAVRTGLILVRRARLWAARQLTTGRIAPATGKPFERMLDLVERYAAAAVLLGGIYGLGRLVGASAWLAPIIWTILRIATILAGARLIIMAARTGQQPFAAWAAARSGSSRFSEYGQQLLRLVPFAERCLEAVVCVTAAAWIIGESPFLRWIRGGPAVEPGLGERIVASIGIFFGARVLVELLHVLLNEAFGVHGDDPVAGQKGRTLVPLLHSTGQYVIYFGALVMIFEQLRLDTKPFLAAAGILGLAVGLGAQNLVTDVVSGLFLLFENQFLVGDQVEIDGASGVVEAIAVRHTQIRDAQGKLHIIPNGQIKKVINASRGGVETAVDVRLEPGEDPAPLIRALQHAARDLKTAHPDLLAVFPAQRLLEAGSNAPGEQAAGVVVRTLIRTRPGAAAALEREFLRLVALRRVSGDEARRAA